MEGARQYQLNTYTNSSSIVLFVSQIHTNKIPAVHYYLNTHFHTFVSSFYDYRTSQQIYLTALGGILLMCTVSSSQSTIRSRFISTPQGQFLSYTYYYTIYFSIVSFRTWWKLKKFTWQESYHNLSAYYATKTALFCAQNSARLRTWAKNFHTYEIHWYSAA